MTADLSLRDPSSAFPATIEQLAARVYELERLMRDRPPVEAGRVEATVQATEPAGWRFLNGQTIVNAQTLHPAAWANCPVSWRSGANLVLPDARGAVLAGAGASVYTTLGALAGSMTTTISTANLPAHSHDLGNHTHSGTTGTESVWHQHNVSGAWGIMSRGPWNGTDWDATFGNNGTASVSFNAPSNQNALHTHSVTTGGPSTNSSGNGPGSSTAMTTAPRGLAVNLMVKIH